MRELALALSPWVSLLTTIFFAVLWFMASAKLAFYKGYFDEKQRQQGFDPDKVRAEELPRLLR